MEMPLCWLNANYNACSYLDVAGGGHVGVDPSVGPVGPPPHLRGTVHLESDMMNVEENVHAKYLDVLDDQVVGVKTLVLGVALGILTIRDN